MGMRHGLARPGAEVARFAVELGGPGLTLCDLDGWVDGCSWLEGSGECGELPEAFDSSVLGFGGEHYRRRPSAGACPPFGRPLVERRSAFQFFTLAAWTRTMWMVDSMG